MTWTVDPKTGNIRDASGEVILRKPRAVRLEVSPLAAAAPALKAALEDMLLLRYQTIVGQGVGDEIARVAAARKALGLCSRTSPLERVLSEGTDMTEPKYLLLKRGLYWRPNSCGYTGVKCAAGRYSLDEASDLSEGRIITDAADAAKPKSSDSVYAIREDLAPRFAPLCDKWVRAEEIERNEAKLAGALHLSVHVMEGIGSALPNKEREKLEQAIEIARKPIGHFNGDLVD